MIHSSGIGRPLYTRLLYLIISIIVIASPIKLLALLTDSINKLSTFLSMGLFDETFMNKIKFINFLEGKPPVVVAVTLFKNF